MATSHQARALIVTATVLFTLAACSGNTQLSKFSVNSIPQFQFKEVTESVGIQSQPTWKYGGPSIADLNGDGRYELMLSNHYEVDAQLFWATPDGKYLEHKSPLMKHDVHGIAPGDYDGDGDADLLVSLGGGNGASPQPPRLLRNDDGELVDVTDQAGLSGRGARGRSVRWVDLDGDADLDILQINAPVVIGENIPRNLMYENLGDGSFRYRPNPEFEQIDAERVLISDFNGDHIPDIVYFSPLSLWQGTASFNFIEVTKSSLPAALHNTSQVMAVADLDIDNDGDLDLYLARGKTYYELANNSVSLDQSTGRLDLRDEGNRSHDGLSFSADGAISLHDFFRWYRAVEFDPKVFLGKNKNPIPAPVDAITIEQQDALGFPESVTENGWYLGYLGNNQWRMEWRLNDNLAWGIRASVSGVTSLNTDWKPESAEVTDILLLNERGNFQDASASLPDEHRGNNWGVTTGDFNNDGWTDLYLYRFGGLNKRVPDVLLFNRDGSRFTPIIDHGAISTDAPEAHGDMGAAFDFDLDGRVDILSGDDDQGTWHLYRNITADRGNYLLVNVAYSPSGLDAIGAEVWIDAGETTLYRRIGSAGATHSQSVLNTVHFGLGAHSTVERIRVRWRDGREEVIDKVAANQLIRAGVERSNN